MNHARLSAFCLERAGRGTRDQACSRAHLSQTTHSDPDNGYVDAGLVNDYRGKGHNISGRGFLPMSELARFRYLLHPN